METPPVSTKGTLVNSLGKSSLTPCRRLGLCRPSSVSLKKPLHLRTLNSMSNEPSVKKKLEDVLKSSDSSQALDVEDKIRTPLKSTTVINKTNSKVRRCLSIGSKTPSLSKVEGLSSNEYSKSRVRLSGQKYDYGKQLESTIKNDCNNTKRFKLECSLISCEQGEQSQQTVKSVINCSPAKSTKSSLVIAEVEGTKEISCEMIQQVILSIKEKKKKLELFKVQDTYAKKHNLEDLRIETTKWRTAGQEALRYSLSLARHAGYCVTLSELMTQHGFPSQLMGYNAEDDEFT